MVMEPDASSTSMAALRGRKRGMRTGYTTGSCATAATRIALLCLLGEPKPEQVTISLPVGEQATFTVHHQEYLPDGSCSASVLKDAGDDPDVTHGAQICATVRWSERPGIEIDGGVGVGRVTKPGLGLEVGTAAINAVPRAMIEAVARDLLSEHGESRGLHIVISVPDGLERARKTLNARLGVIGGISILGTTGIVKPYSTAAYKASISKAVDVAVACEHAQHIVLTTGSRSEKFARRYISLAEEAYIQMGEFTGHGLKDCVQKGVREITLVGMIGKLSKIGDGRMQTHVAGAEVNLRSLAAVAESCGGDATVVDQVLHANTARHFQELMMEHNLLNVFPTICERARQVSAKYIQYKAEVDVLMCDFDGSFLGYAGERDIN